MFESTLILDQQALLTWASAGTLTGTLQDHPAGTFDWTIIANRDRQLARRDIVLANSIADLAATAATVWGCPVVYSAPPEPEVVTLPGDMPSSEVVHVAGTLVHVKPSSTPDAGLSSDTDLLRRDVAILEGIRQLAIKVPNAIISGTLPGQMNLGVAWSLAEGADSGVTINPSLPLGVDAFKSFDADLANRDNQLALNLATISQVLKNPFLTATRLLIKSTTRGREAEIYVLTQDDATKRVWRAEPGLEGRLEITYYKLTQEITWADADTTIPTAYAQPYALGGTTAGSVEIEPVLDARKDAQFWHTKASQIKPFQVTEEMLLHVTEPGKTATGDVNECQGAALFVRPGQTTIQLSEDTMAAAMIRVAVLFTPKAELVIDGAKGVGGIVSDESYTDFPAAGGAISWDVKVPAGNWELAIYYSNLTGTVANSWWPFLVQLGGHVISNLGLRAPDTTSTVVNSRYFVSVVDELATTLLLTWAPATTTNQLRIHRIVFTRAASPQSYKLTARLGPVEGGVLNSALATSQETIEFDSYPYRTDTASFVFALAEPIANPGLELTWVPVSGSLGLTPLSLDQVMVMTRQVNTVTPNADGLDGWPSEMASRAVDAVTESFQAGLRLNPGFDPTDVIEQVRYWTLASTDRWLTMLRTLESRFDQAFRTGGPGDVGHPAIVPKWLSYDVLNKTLSRDVTLEAEVAGQGGTLTPAIAPVLRPGSLCYPTLAAFQPWMARLGLPVMREGFWAENTIPTKLLPVSLRADPYNGGLISGAGNYAYGSSVEITATIDPTVVTVDVGVDMVVVVDESGSMDTAWAYIPTMLSQLDAELRAAGIGSATVHNRYGLVGQGIHKNTVNEDLYVQTDGNVITYMMGAANTPWTEVDPSDPETGFAPMLSAAVRLGTDYKTADYVTEDAYAGIDAAIRLRTWRTGVARVIIFITDENRNYQTYVSPGVLQNYNGSDYLTNDWSAARQALIDQVDAWGGSLHGATTVTMADSVAATILGHTKTGKTYKADGAGGFTTGIGGHSTGEGANATGVDENGVHYLSNYMGTLGMTGWATRMGYHDMLMALAGASSSWTFTLFRDGGLTQQSFSAALIDSLKDDILMQLGWQFYGWYHQDGTLFSLNPTVTLDVTKAYSLTASFHHVIVGP